MAAQNLIVMGRSFKAVLEDKSKKDHEMTINWKDIENASEFEVREGISWVYKKIYHFAADAVFCKKEELN